MKRKNRHLILVILIMAIMFVLVACDGNDDSTKKIQTNVTQYNTSTLKNDWTKFFVAGSGLSVDKSKEWMNYFRKLYTNYLGIPEFKRNSPIDNKTLILYALSRYTDSTFFVQDLDIGINPVETVQIKSGAELYRYKKDYLESEVKRIFDQEILKNETPSVKGTIEYRNSFYWISPHGIEGPPEALVPRILDYNEKKDGTLEFEIEFHLFQPGYQDDKGYEPEFKIKNESGLKVENLFSKLNENTQFEDKGIFKKNRITLKKVNSSRYVIIENIEIK